jgi:hypothetical protein
MTSDMIYPEEHQYVEEMQFLFMLMESLDIPLPFSSYPEVLEKIQQIKEALISIDIAMKEIK